MSGLIIADYNFFINMKKAIDKLIQDRGLKATPDDLSGTIWTEPNDDPDFTTEVDIRASGIASVIWATGYRFDFSLVRLPLFDEFGYPMQNRGVTAYPGLYFVGLHWLHKRKSGLLIGVGEDAKYIADSITSRS